MRTLYLSGAGALIAVVLPVALSVELPPEVSMAGKKMVDTMTNNALPPLPITVRHNLEIF